MIETRNHASLGLILAYLTYFRAFDSYFGLFWGLLGQLGGFGGLFGPILNLDKGIWGSFWVFPGAPRPIFLGVSAYNEPILGLSRGSGPILSLEFG